MRCLVTGCAGFIGSHLVDCLLGQDHVVVGYDNFSTGLDEFLKQALRNKNFTLIRADLLDRETLNHAAREIDFVFHMAANADVRFGIQHPGKDLEQNAIGTFNVLETTNLIA